MRAPDLLAEDVPGHQKYPERYGVDEHDRYQGSAERRKRERLGVVDAYLHPDPVVAPYERQKGEGHKGKSWAGSMRRQGPVEPSVVNTP